MTKLWKIWENGGARAGKYSMKIYGPSSFLVAKDFTSFCSPFFLYYNQTT
jgi:hypothetical protein